MSTKNIRKISKENIKKGEKIGKNCLKKFSSLFSGKSRVEEKAKEFLERYSTATLAIQKLILEEDEKSQSSDDIDREFRDIYATYIASDLMDGRRNKGLSFNNLVFNKESKGVRKRVFDIASQIIPSYVEREESRTENLENMTKNYFNSLKKETAKRAGDDEFGLEKNFFYKNPLSYEGRVYSGMVSESELEREEAGDDLSLEQFGGYKESVDLVQNLIRRVENFEKAVKIQESPVSGGVLLYGPPGCGKTRLAKTIASTSSLPFYKIRGSDIGSTYTDGSMLKLNKKLEGIYQNIEKGREDGAIIFYDEIDGLVAGHRDNKEDNKRLTTLLQTLEESRQYDKVINVLATNKRRELPESLVRSGRIKHEIEIGLPNAEDRKEIFKIHLKKANNYSLKNLGEKIITDYDLEELGAASKGLSGADIAEYVVKEAKDRATDLYLTAGRVTPIRQDYLLGKIEEKKDEKMPKKNYA